MRQRVITAVIALAIFIPILLAGGIWLEIAAAALAVVGIFEIYIMRKRIIVSMDFVITVLGTLAVAVPMNFYKGWLPDSFTRLDVFYVFAVLLLIITVLSKNKFNFEDVGVSVVSMIYIGTGFHYLASVRNSDGGLGLLMFALIVVWSTDIFAYTFGRKIGKHKLWPAISPNKTWEGTIGGVVSALVLSGIYMYFVPQQYSMISMLLIAFVLSVFGQMGDLIESAYKRYYKVKDSGNILPGHGGILDRFDSMLIVLPLLHIFGLV
ncbi:phosphatidate cytidylyltransferase [Companilactobacillus nodensis]|uniref:Phosphatidate cytidylyltransferase n=1 Tax=Companilactobacillus nodensis DSM 19682 = JCM 14932 = NBRC 107160 TaxID=1423775 RepID=A0A0R1KLE8_9LACO|nr:phosphatidate cytidylyltransferase [Companilactobacillus nodensis]KRK80023.1 phosphatidate cytidylyltransferase [Companilactobacillus nodensis DSM 19682 = JCM 14932 = NBRC 107160]